jgi:hypothetical protein
MPFYDIACHVWSIDGYDDDARARLVDDTYTHTANASAAPSRRGPSRNAQLKTIVDAVRRSVETPVTTESVYILGGYRKADDKAPEHMWIVYQNNIYETMPEKSLFRRTVTDIKSLTPLESLPFDKTDIGVYETVLSESQLAEIRRFNAGEPTP